MRRITSIVATALVLAACGGAGEAPAASSPAGPASDPSERSDQTSSRRTDPRKDGLDVALGEWAITLKAGAIRPGRVTFAVVNRGTIGHGFEIELEGEDSSGHGGGDDDGVKAETNLLQPGETAELTLDLPAGLYKVECIVPGHDDLGMEGFLEVRAGAPLVRTTDPADPNAVSIRDFAFDPAQTRVRAGTEVSWTNRDQTQHTVTAGDGGFDSGPLDPGDTFTVRMRGNGPVTYACVIHPEMTGTIVVGSSA